MMDQPTKPHRMQLTRELRAAIHAWLRGNPDADMTQICAAFASCKPDTVRKTIQRMRGHGSVYVAGKRGTSIRLYRARGDAPQLVKRISTPRKQKPTAARAPAAPRAARNPAAPVATAPVTPVEQQPPFEQIPGGKTVYRSGDNPEIRKQQRGQGAVRPRACVNCYQLY